MASSAGAVTLRGGFAPGTRVKLIEVDGPHVLRPPEGADVVDEQEVDENGCLSFSKGVTQGNRYFAVGIDRNGYRAVRLTGGTKETETGLAGYDPVTPDRVKLSDGSYVDEAPEQGQKPDVPEGATWLGQHQVPKDTLQRSNTPRGAAAVISAEELERAQRGHRKQEPTEPIVEAVEESEDPATAPARTSKPAAKTPAKTTGKGK